MNDQFGRRAIVIGAGISGLAAAGALSSYFDSVTVLERDALPTEAEARQGTPQSKQPHVLLCGGQRALSGLFPEFEQDLIAAGAVPYRVGLDAREELPGYDPFPQRDLGWTGYSMSRPLIELVMRRCVQRLLNITFREHCRVFEIVANNDGSAAGVRYSANGGDPEELQADLIVDASGRGALTLAFFECTGRPIPPQTTVGLDISYTTAIFAASEGKRDWKLAVTFPDLRADFHGGLLIPVEGDRWMVTVTERHSGSPPATIDAFLSLARQLRTSTIYDTIKDATRLEELQRFGFTESRWRHYDRMPDFPRGLLPIGDALCRFNPIYGQGMSVAAQEALVLRDLLQSRNGSADPLAGLGQVFIAEAQPLIGAAWSMSAIPDFINPQTRGERPANLEQTLQFTGALRRIAARDPEVHKLIIAVRHLILPSSALGDPELVRRVMSEIGGAI